MRLHSVIALLLISLSCSAAEVFTWTDETGKKHFGDRPPEIDGSNTQSVTKETYELENIDSGYPDYDPERYRKMRQKNATQSSSSESTASNDGFRSGDPSLENCRVMSERLSSISAGVSHKGPDGEDVYVKATQLHAEEKALKARYSEECADRDLTRLYERPKCNRIKLTAPHLTAAEYREALKNTKKRCLEQQKKWDRAGR